MDILHIKSFLGMMKTHGFSKTANLVHRSQPTVSRHIKELEDYFGVKFFERFGPLSVKPTKEAYLLKKVLSPLLDDLDSARDRFNELRGHPGRTEIRLATHESVISYVLPDIVSLFKLKHPDATLSLFRRSRPEIVDMVLEGDVDFGITSLDKVPPGINYEILGRYPRVLIAQKGHPLARKKAISLKDIAKYPLILPPMESRTRRIVDRAFAKEGLDYKLFLEIMGRDAVRTYVSKGFGLSVMSEYFILPSDKKMLCAINVSKFFGHSERAILMRKGKVLSPLLQALISAIGS